MTIAADTFPKVLMIFTSLLTGVTMVMGINAINSAPSFMLDYYKYINHSEDTVSANPTFWKNILNFYTVVTMVAQAIHEPTNITSFMCRFSLLFRLEVSCVVMMLELFVILILPHTATSETGAMVAMMIMAYLGGAARAYFENTGYALFGPCPSIMMSAILIGAAVSGAVVSALQIILMASMPDTYDSVLTQSIIYFSLAMGIIFLAGCFLAALLYNPVARRYVAELRSTRSPWANIYRPLKSSKSGDDEAEARYRDVDVDAELTDPPPQSSAAALDQDVLFDFREAREDGESMVGLEAEPVPAPKLDSTAAAGTFVHSDEDGDALTAAADGLTTAELLQAVRVWPVIKKIYPMMGSCFLAYCVTYLMYPGMMLVVDSADGWFTTLVMAVFNFADLFGRLATLWRRLWPPRWVIVAAAFARIALVPLMVLNALHIIPSQAAAYVLAAVLGVSNGFVGTLAMVYSPDSPGLQTDGERAIAGQLTGAALLLGCAVGSLIQLAEVIPFNS